MKDKTNTDTIYDVIIIGGGQSALACGYFLRRTGLRYLILDDQKQAGGAWQNGWESLTLFSPSAYSSLPGWMMPEAEGRFPTRNETINYLEDYEKKYDLLIKRPIEVKSVDKINDHFELLTSNGSYVSKTVVSATGTWKNPFIPEIRNKKLFKGEQIHSAHYKNPLEMQGKKVLVVGGGNSGAQLLAEISKVATTTWSTLTPPEFLPDDVDGRVLFNVATAKYNAEKEGKPFDPSLYNLSHIVMVPPVLEARERNVLFSKGRFIAMTEHGVVWEDGEEENFDVIVWCTGFSCATAYLQNLGVINDGGKADTNGTQSIEVSGLWFLGYGNWTGFASATLIGVGRSARATVNEITTYLK